MGGFRRFLIKTAEIMMAIGVIIVTIVSAISGASSGYWMMGAAGAILGIIIGAVLGFVFTAIVAAYFFLLQEIAENTRRIR